MFTERIRKKSMWCAAALAALRRAVLIKIFFKVWKENVIAQRKIDYYNKRFIYEK